MRGTDVETKPRWLGRLDVLLGFCLLFIYSCKKITVSPFIKILPLSITLLIILLLALKENLREAKFIKMMQDETDKKLRELEKRMKELSISSSVDSNQPDS